MGGSKASKPKPAPAPEAPVTAEDEEVRSAVEEERKRLRNSGRESTLFISNPNANKQGYRTVVGG